MTQPTTEKRGELLSELDNIVTEIKSLRNPIADISQKLRQITFRLDEDVSTHCDTRPSPYSKEQLLDPPNWQPDELNLAELRNQQARLRELINKRNQLEKQLGVTIK
jgi:uncharacterized coiled-coil DUF342 family protein